MESLGTLDVDLYNVNSDPVAQAGTSPAWIPCAMPTGRSPALVAVSDADGDSVSLEAATGSQRRGREPGARTTGARPPLWWPGGTARCISTRAAVPDSLQYRYVLTDAAAGGRGRRGDLHLRGG